MRNFLVTTALKDTLPSGDGNSVVFLGDWCHNFGDEYQNSSQEKVTVPYHWNDNIKKHADYDYLMALYEKCLSAISIQLNEMHAVDYSNRYWRIVLGPWLGCFVQVLYDRWESIRYCLDLYPIQKSIRLNVNSHLPPPQNIWDFYTLFYSDYWNHKVYMQILNESASIDYIDKELNFQISGSKSHLSSAQRIRKIIEGAYTKLHTFFYKDTDVFTISNYLPEWISIKLQLSMHQLPWRIDVDQPPIVDSDFTQRSWLLNINAESEFELFIQKVIAQYIPVCHLEGYNDLVGKVNSLKWPKSPKAVFTSNSHLSNDTFKLWLASRVESGSKLVVGQHGGYFGIGKKYFIEEHDVSICDRYLSWGWNEVGNKSIVPVGCLKMFKDKKNSYAKNQRLLLVLGIVPKYSYHIMGLTMASQFNSYLNDQFKFINLLSPNIYDSLTVRLHYIDYGWKCRERFERRFADVTIDDGRTKVRKLMKNTRIYVATYNATTFLESLSINMPTIIFWDESYTELRGSAIPYFELLKSVNIFHTSFESAALHINRVWDTVDNWWFDNRLQEVVRLVKSEYVRYSDNMVDRIKMELLS